MRGICPIWAGITSDNIYSSPRNYNTASEVMSRTLRSTLANIMCYTCDVKILFWECKVLAKIGSSDNNIASTMHDKKGYLFGISRLHYLYSGGSVV